MKKEAVKKKAEEIQDRELRSSYKYRSQSETIPSGKSKDGRRV